MKFILDTQSEGSVYDKLRVDALDVFAAMSAAWELHQYTLATRIVVRDETGATAGTLTVEYEDR